MASFDFIDAAAKGYEVVFKNFTYLARVALPALFMYVLCSLIVLMFASDMDMLRSGLIMFPATLVQGLYFAGLIRFVLYAEPIHVWGTLIPVPKTQPEARAEIFAQGGLGRTQAIQAGALVYALICLSGAAFFGTMEHLAQEAALALPQTPDIPAASDAPAPPQGTLAQFIMLIPIFLAFLWGIRLCFAYVPMSMGFRFDTYMRAMQGMRSSCALLMMGMMCILPPVTLLMPVLSALLYLFKPIPSIAPVVFVIALSVILLLSFSILVSAAAFGLNQMMRGKDAPRA